MKLSSTARLGAPVETRHTALDDLQAGATAVVLVSLGLALLQSAGLATGGTPGIAFLLSYATGLPLSVALLLVNLPFYVLGWRTLGPRFTLKTLAAVTALAGAVEAVDALVSVQAGALYAALAGGVLIGMGLLVMFRHNSSFGGVSILALALQKRYAWRAGTTQLAIDLAVLAGALLVLDAQRVGWSLLGAAAMNLVLICNHKPGRYLAAH
jgi:uncharacterized membrane-anchored protein YitT (DUF2179 family)